MADDVHDQPGREDLDLVRALVAGDERAWERFLDRYGSLLTGLARRMLERRVGAVRPVDADEVVAEVLLSLWRDERRLLARYDPRWRLSTWLGVLCRVEVGRWLRRRRRASSAALSDALPPREAGADPARDLGHGERREQLAEALAALPPRDALLLALRYRHGLSYAAIAEVLGVASESIGPLLARARRRLAEQMPEDPPER